MSISGVNIGGWLVLERWMTPSLFAGLTAKNEYELSQTTEGRARIQAHQVSFMGEDDFMWLHNQGVTSLRIPVGYWIFGDAEPYIGAIERLDWAVAMAKKYEMQVLIDLHGAPGAQNAADHSGSGRPGLPVWLDDVTLQEKTIQTLVRLAKRYYDSEAVWGLELINEPLADRLGFKLIRFYRRAYKRLLNVARPGLYIVFADGFKPLLLTGALRRRKHLPVVMDCHLYQCFSEADKALTLNEHLKKATRRRRLIRFLQLWQPVIVGEWSGVLPWSLLQAMSDSEREQARVRFTIHQLDAYSLAQSAFYWTYKTEKDSAWNLRTTSQKASKVIQ